MATLSPYMLVYEQDSNILSIMCIPVERLLDCRCLRLRVDHQEVLLGIRWLSDMLLRSISQSSFHRKPIDLGDLGGRTPMPASSRPVTES